MTFEPAFVSGRLPDWRRASHSGAAVSIAARKSIEIAFGGKTFALQIPDTCGWVEHFRPKTLKLIDCANLIIEGGADQGMWLADWRQELVNLVKPDILVAPHHGADWRSLIFAKELLHLHVSEGSARKAMRFYLDAMRAKSEEEPADLERFVEKLTDWLRVRVWFTTRVLISPRRQLASLREWTRVFIIHTGISPPLADSVPPLSPGHAGEDRAPDFRPRSRAGVCYLRPSRLAAAYRRRRALAHPSAACRAELGDDRRNRRDLPARRRPLPRRDRRELGDHLCVGRGREPRVLRSAGSLLTGRSSW